MRIYHLGIVAGDMLPYGHNTPCKRKTLYLQARRSVDFLSCDLWLYLGERITTKVRLAENANEILAMVNKQQGTNYKRLVVE